jgi:hypothetical protein
MITIIKRVMEELYHQLDIFSIIMKIILRNNKILMKLDELEGIIQI